jgi:hypothetical protein
MDAHADDGLALQTEFFDVSLLPYGFDGQVARLKQQRADFEVVERVALENMLADFQFVQVEIPLFLDFFDEESGRPGFEPIVLNGAVCHKIEDGKRVIEEIFQVRNGCESFKYLLISALNPFSDNNPPLQDNNPHPSDAAPHRPDVSTHAIAWPARNFVGIRKIQ